MDGPKGSAGQAARQLRYEPSTPLDRDSDAYFLRPALLFEALAPHAKAQLTGSACSVAASLTVVNTLLSLSGHPAIDEAALVATDPHGNWQSLVWRDDAPGVSLSQLTGLLAGACSALGLRIALEKHHIESREQDTVSAVRMVLEACEAAPLRRFMIANFNQSKFLADGVSEGHMAVVAGFDGHLRRVLILDSDRRRFAPYWVPLERFVEGMCTQDTATAQPRGFLLISRGSA